MQARRSRHSVTIHDRTRAFQGFNLFTPLCQNPANAWLIDMNGNIMHRWALPGAIRLHADLLPNGHILCGVTSPQQEQVFTSIPFAGAKLIEMDWDGNIVWEYEEPFMDSHDRVRLQNGNTLIMKYTELPKEYADKVLGGEPGSDLVAGKRWTFMLQEITPDGKVAHELHPWTKLDPKLDDITPYGSRFIWPGWNSLEELPNGDIMCCSYNTSNIVILDRQTCDVKWRWGQGKISFPHNPTMLDNGNILVLDNNRYCVDRWMPPDGSRVIEINPKTNEIEWQYSSPNPTDFYTTYIGGAERQPNGNTLICEGAMGRFLEVTPQGEIVWEYVSPFYADLGPQFAYGPSNAVFRVHRYAPDYPGLRAMHPERHEHWNRLYGPQACDPCLGVAPGFPAVERGDVVRPARPADNGSWVSGAPSAPSAATSRPAPPTSKEAGFRYGY